MSFHKYSLFTEKGYQLTKKYTVPRTYLGMGRYAAYKDFGESTWKIGFGSETIDNHYLDCNDRASQKNIVTFYFPTWHMVLKNNLYKKRFFLEMQLSGQTNQEG